MALSDFTDSWIRGFAPQKIYDRGVGYARTGHVHDLEYLPEDRQLRAFVAGNSGTYDVTVTERGTTLDAVCDCPYEGAPCKHVVAVLVEFLSNRDRYLDDARTRTRHRATLREHLLQLPSPQLVDLVLTWAAQHSSLEETLRVHVAPEDADTRRRLLVRVNRTLASVGRFDEDLSDLEIIRELKGHLTLAGKTSPETQCTIHAAILHRILQYLNEYGVDDAQWEDLALVTLERLTQELPRSPSFHAQRETLMTTLRDAIDEGNCGLIGELEDALNTVQTLEQA